MITDESIYPITSKITTTTTDSHDYNAFLDPELCIYLIDQSPFMAESGSSSGKKLPYHRDYNAFLNP